ncbi:shikimate kinase [Haloferula helveola]|uniref:Shikimate kinase n=1 Tax=Haloferula helveola TaxID=490095 RepID=A0ABM7RJS1_9BACT|nr:shikimate kinase [Haloferula helveola]
MSSEIPKNIILVGFMGCGKSTIGRRLGQMLGYPFVDTDDLIESKAGMPITEIFERRGEEMFRQLEAAVLQELGSKDAGRAIIATGGGIIGRRRNRRLLKELGFVVWLQVSPDTIIARTKRNRDRPLLATDNPRERIDRLLAEREPLYREVADLELDTSELDAEEIACGILESARYHFTGGA